MYILLAAATHTEIHPFQEYLVNHRSSGIEWETEFTGIGLVAATYSFMRLVTRRRPDLVIQAGIAGSFRPDLLAKTCCVKAEMLGDMGVMEDGKYKTIFDLGLADKNNFPFQDGWLPNPYEDLLAMTGVPAVNGVTVHTVTTNSDNIVRFQQKEAAVVESMEGAALHYVCLMEKIPFIQLRAVSNLVGERNKSRWKIRAAVQDLCQTLIHFDHQIRSADAANVGLQPLSE